MKKQQERESAESLEATYNTPDIIRDEDCLVQVEIEIRHMMEGFLHLRRKPERIMETSHQLVGPKSAPIELYCKSFLILKVTLSRSFIFLQHPLVMIQVIAHAATIPVIVRGNLKILG